MFDTTTNINEWAFIKSDWTMIAKIEWYQHKDYARKVYPDIDLNDYDILIKYLTEEKLIRINVVNLLNKIYVVQNVSKRLTSKQKDTVSEFVELYNNDESKSKQIIIEWSKWVKSKTNKKIKIEDVFKVL